MNGHAPAPLYSPASASIAAVVSTLSEAQLIQVLYRTVVWLDLCATHDAEITPLDVLEQIGRFAEQAETPNGK